MKSNNNINLGFVFRKEKSCIGTNLLGLTNNEIAKKLNISTYTVDGHRRNLIIKTE